MNFEIFSGKSEDWDNYLHVAKNEEFLQSYSWGEFQSQEGKSVLRIRGMIQDKVVYQAQGFVHLLPLGMKYLYFPHNLPLTEKIDDFLDFLKKQGFVFARFEPIEDFESIKYKKRATHHRQYQYTSVIDLLLSDEELSKNFHEKTRYNIRLAAKKGVTIKNEKNADIFWPLIKETYERDGIKSHSQQYYRDFIALSGCTQMTAYFGDTPLASVLLYTFGKTCVYVHGASSNTNRNLMAPYLLQWEALQYARVQGCLVYDLGGVAKPVASNSPHAETFFTSTWDKNDKLSGVTRFKAGFNGTIKHYADASDIIFDSMKYSLYTLARKFL
jgi:lipid II:glycine glycyltransferase (peptidoglycan interpeptide bridge formation enzyme)